MGKPKTKANLMTRRQLAEKLDVHMQTVTKWERDGLPIAERGRKGKPSHYDEVQVRAWLQAREEAAQNDEVLDLARARARKEHWQAMLNEQSHRVRARDLLPRLEVERAWSTEIAAVRTLILSSYVTHADRVFRAAHTDGLPGVERELRDLAHEILRELSDPGRPVEPKPTKPSKRPSKASAEVAA